jgi:hypothetical protein
MKCILDQFDVIEAAVPQFLGRLDRSKVAGRSLGGHTPRACCWARGSPGPTFAPCSIRRFLLAAVRDALMAGPNPLGRVESK